MQPKPFIYRMAKIKEALESKGHSQASVASHVAVPPPSSIASRMRVSAACESDAPIVCISKNASKTCTTSQAERERRTSPQPTASLEQAKSSSMDDVLTTPTNSRSVSPRNEDDDEAPRSLKRKRQSPKVLATPSNSAPSTPAHTQSSRATTPGSPSVSRKTRSLRRGNPAFDEQPKTPSRPRLRSEAKKLITEAGQGSNDSRSLQAELAALRADLENEKLANSKLRAETTEDKQLLENLRAELNTLCSVFANKRSEAEEELVSLRADIELLRYEFEGETGEQGSINPETSGKLDKVIHMNDMLRRVLQGERIYNEEMRGKLHSLRKKVGPLLAKVDALQGSVEEMRAHFSAHDAPIELIMDFVRNFHQWWVDRYTARQGGGRSGENDRVQA